MHHLKMKFLVGDRVGVIRIDQSVTWRCYATLVGECHQVSILDPRATKIKQRGKLVEDLDSVIIQGDKSTQMVKVGTKLDPKVKAILDALKSMQTCLHGVIRTCRE